MPSLVMIYNQVYAFFLHIENKNEMLMLYEMKCILMQ